MISQQISLFDVYIDNEKKHITNKTKPKTIQGKSLIATPIKQFGVLGHSHMQTLRRRLRKDIKGIVFCDVFCGDGVNRISSDYVVDGSPISIIKGYEKASNSGQIGVHENGDMFIFSDIRQDALDSLKYMIPEHLTDKCFLMKNDAGTQIEELHDFLIKNPGYECTLFVDPNGPKEFPYKQLIKISEDYRLKKRLDIVIHISATTYKRCIGAAHTDNKKLQFDDWLFGIEHLGNDFIMKIASGREGWVREPLKGDGDQWTIISFFGYPPRNDWNKQGYVKIDSEEGENAIYHYSTTNKQKGIK